MRPVVNSRHLRSVGYEVVVPFRVQLECDGSTIELVCGQVLRVLPGRRLVCFGKWDGRQVVVKFFLNPRGAKRHCACEERGVNALRDAGINTPVLLFKGVLRPDNTPVLGFERITPAQDLATAWEQAKGDSERIEMISRAVTLIASQHEAGLKHEDLHLRNFLLAGDDIYTIDGAAVDVRQRGKPLPEAKSLRNLGLLFAQLYPRFDLLVPRAFQVYAETRAWSGGLDLYTRLMREVRSHRDRRKSDFLKKIYRECSAFVCRKTWGHFMVCDRDFHNKAMTSFLADPDPMIEAGRLLKDGNTSTVALVEAGNRRLVVKRYNIKNTWHAFKRCLRPSRACVSWRNAHRLALLGILTPKPIALIEKRWGPFRSRAYFITEHVEGVDVYHLLHSDEAKKSGPKDMVKQFGKLLQLLVDSSISHGDFKATNFVVANGELFLTDLDVMCEHRFRWRFRLAFRRDCERLMKNWKDMPKFAKIFNDRLAELEL